MAVIFKKISLHDAKLEYKNEKNAGKTFYLGDHILLWTVILKKKVFTLFSNQCATSDFKFFKSGSSCENRAHPWSAKV